MRSSRARPAVVRAAVLVCVAWAVAEPATAGSCQGDPANPNIAGASGDVVVSGGSCVHVEAAGAVNGRVWSNGGYSLRIDGSVSRLTGTAVQDIGNGASAHNAGTISALGGSGVALRDGSSARNDGNIVAGGNGIDVWSGSTIVNRGSITAVGRGLRAREDAVLRNEAGGTVLSGQHGLEAGFAAR